MLVVATVRACMWPLNIHHHKCKGLDAFCDDVTSNLGARSSPSTNQCLSVIMVQCNMPLTVVQQHLIFCRKAYI